MATLWFILSAVCDCTQQWLWAHSHGLRSIAIFSLECWQHQRFSQLSLKYHHDRPPVLYLATWNSFLVLAFLVVWRQESRDKTKKTCFIVRFISASYMPKRGIKNSTCFQNKSFCLVPVSKRQAFISQLSSIHLSQDDDFFALFTSQTYAPSYSQNKTHSITSFHKQAFLYPSIKTSPATAVGE